MIIVQTSGQADTASAFASIALLALVSIVLYYALVLIERLALPWVRATTSQR
jgi:NitT/TauT family transport system permease protein